MTPRFDAIPAMLKIKEASSTGRAKWRTQSELIFVDSLHRPWIVPPGFITDFASVERLPLMFLLAGDTAHMSAVLHDYLCRHYVVPRQMTWKEAAKIFKQAMKAEGTPAWRRWLMYTAVKLVGSMV